MKHNGKTVMASRRRILARTAVLPVFLTVIACQDTGIPGEARDDHLNEQAVTELPESFVLPAHPSQELPGIWSEGYGAVICEGYVTNRQDQEYCADSAPDDWVPFEFNGSTYYVHPLALANQSHAKIPNHVARHR